MSTASVQYNGTISIVCSKTEIKHDSNFS